jgi:hypothetical protein
VVADVGQTISTMAENGVESRPVSLGAVIAMSTICGVIVAAIGYDRGHAFSEWFQFLTRVDERLIAALIRLWRSS